MACRSDSMNSFRMVSGAPRRRYHFTGRRPYRRHTTGRYLTAVDHGVCEGGVSVRLSTEWAADIPGTGLPRRTAPAAAEPRTCPYKANGFYYGAYMAGDDLPPEWARIVVDQLLDGIMAT